jgi:hypothetical protein
LQDLEEYKKQMQEQAQNNIDMVAQATSQLTFLQ